MLEANVDGAPVAQVVVRRRGSSRGPQRGPRLGSLLWRRWWGTHVVLRQVRARGESRRGGEEKGNGKDRSAPSVRIRRRTEAGYVLRVPRRGGDWPAWGRATEGALASAWLDPLIATPFGAAAYFPSPTIPDKMVPFYNLREGVWDEAPAGLLVGDSDLSREVARELGGEGADPRGSTPCTRSQCKSF